MCVLIFFFCAVVYLFESYGSITPAVNINSSLCTRWRFWEGRLLHGIAWASVVTFIRRPVFPPEKNLPVLGGHRSRSDTSENRNMFCFYRDRTRFLRHPAPILGTVPLQYSIRPWKCSVLKRKYVFEFLYENDGKAFTNLKCLQYTVIRSAYFMWWQARAVVT